MARNLWTLQVSLLVASSIILHVFRVRAITQPEFPAFETESRIVLSEGRGYKDVLIAIGENVPEDDQLIDEIMEVFEDFSSFLYTATDVYGSGLFFEEVRILIPDSWSDNPRYEPRTWESFGASDIRIDHPPGNSLSNRNQPSTNKPTHCGSPGLYIHLTPEYITNDDVARPYGDRGKTLTHEWGHYRWGVFDEYPLPGDDHFYATGDGSYEATRCVAAIRGTERRSDLSRCTYDPVSGRPDDECRFIDDMGQSETYQASLMYKQFLPEMRTFCDSPDVTRFGPSTTHNVLAPNQQNIQCAARSIWEVMRQHSDFPSTVPPQGGMPPIGALPQINVVPNFRLIKQQGTREPIVLVLDTSSSMNMHQRLHVLRQASFNLITRVLDDNQLFAVVTFNNTARTVIPLAEAGQDRTKLTNLLPDSAGGLTSIGAGILEGIRLIGSTLGSYSGIQMIVLTDGKETNPPSINDVATSEVLSGITVHTIAIGPQASPSLEGIANRTDGETFEHSDQSAALFNIFTQLAIQDDSGIVTILSEGFVTNNITRRFSPGSLSDDTMTVLVGFPSGFINDSVVTVTKPNGDVINNSTRLTATDMFRTIHAFGLVQIDTEVMPGEWQIGVKYYGDNIANLTGTMHVETSRRRAVTTGNVAPVGSGTVPSVVLPIEIDAEWGLPNINPCQIQTVQVTVSEGYTPVADAKVEVTVSRPENTIDSKVNVDVFDDGVGADVRKDDGVYSGFFTDFKGEGRYNMEVTVTGVEGVTKVMNGYRVGQGPAAANPEFLQEEQPDTEFTGRFNRFIVGNSFVCMDEDLCSGDQDLYSPYRITDLRGFLEENRTAVLNFTATGDDLDRGTATYYELRIATNITEMLERFNDTQILKFIPEALRTNETKPPYVISGNLSSPLPSRNTEVFRVKLPDSVGEFSYIFSVVAVDDEGRRSQPSNYASITGNIVQEPISPGLVILLVIVILLLCAIIILVVYFIRKMKQPKKTEDAEMINGSRADLTKNEVIPGALIQTANLRHGVDRNSNTQDPGDNYRFVTGNTSVGTGERTESAYHFTDAPVSSNYTSRATKVYTEPSGLFRGIRNPVFVGNAGNSPSPGHPPPRPPRSDLSTVVEDDDSYDYDRVPDPNNTSSVVIGMMQRGLRGPVLPQKMNAAKGNAQKAALVPPPKPTQTKQPTNSSDFTVSEHEYDEPPPSSMTRKVKHSDDDHDSDKDDYEPVIDPNTGIPFGLA